MEYLNLLYSRKDSTNTLTSDNNVRTNKKINLENLFLSPRIVVKDSYESFNSKKPTIERNYVLLDYINLPFQRNKYLYIY